MSSAKNPMSSTFESRQHGLLVNDSLVLASTREANVDGLASADTDFRRVKGLMLFEPDDLA